MKDTNTNQERAKTSVIKVLAIIGLISVVVLAIWGTVQAVRVLPSAFSSLASVADTVYNNRPVDSLSVTTEQDIVNTGESFKISWDDLKREGEYSFYYTCTEGVSAEVRFGGNDTSSIRCGSPTLIPEDETSFDMIVHSERRRFTDVPFTVAFTPANADETLFERNSKITVVNASIPQSVDVAIENGEADESETDADTETESEDTDPEDTPDTGSQPHRSGPRETTEQQTYSYIPQSREDGFTDLKVTYLGVGTLDDGTFVPAGSIDSDERGAIRFEVRNIGTKTSADWSFEATLPTGFVFESSEQTGLRPNEKAVYTLGFGLGDEDGTQPIGVDVSVKNDTNKNNNAFEWSVRVD